jgi:hypothetical protein
MKKDKKRVQLTKNQKGFQKMLKHNQKVPFYLFSGFDDIHAIHEDKISQIRTSRYLHKLLN